MGARLLSETPRGRRGEESAQVQETNWFKTRLLSWTAMGKLL